MPQISYGRDTLGVKFKVVGDRACIMEMYGKNIIEELQDNGA